MLHVLLWSHVGAQDLEAVHARIQTATSDRNYVAAIDELNRLNADQPDIFETNNYNYLLARLAERTGDVATAAANYQRVVNSKSVLKDYAVWHLAQLARGTGNLLLERTYLQQIVEFSPDSQLATVARSRTVRSWSESGNYDQVIRLLNTPLAQSSTASDSKRAEQIKRQNMVLLAEAYLKSGDAAKARDIYTRLITEIANAGQPDDFALAAAKGLDTLDAGKDGKDPSAAAALSDYEHLRRANIYQFNRDFEGARRHLLTILANFPQSGIAPDAMFQIGRGFAQEGDHEEAVNWFERLRERFPEHAVSRDALLQAASAYSRLGKYHEAVARYQKFIDAYKDDERIDRAYLNIVDTLRDARQDSEALQWAAKIQEVFKGKQTATLGLFDEVKIHLSRSDWQNALAALDKLIASHALDLTSVPGGTNAAEIVFLRGLVLEDLGRNPEAIDTYLSVPDGRNEYYGSMATERLRTLAVSDQARALAASRISSLTDPANKDKDAKRRDLQAAIRLTASVADRQKLLAALKELYTELPAYRSVPQFELLKLGRQQIRREKQNPEAGDRNRAIADELLFLGLYDEAGPEAESAYKAKQNSPTGLPKTGLDYTIASIYNRGGRSDRAAAFIESLWKLPTDYQFELIPRDVAEMLYPVPYADLLIQHAPQRGVDPRYLLSIMRQESRFRADVKSNAAARGLMQFISSTAIRVADELGRKGFVQDALYEPSIAILFGSQYLGDLFKIFPNQPEAVAASYNGGDDNVKRWISRSRSDRPERYVSEVVFAQSKDYVYRVMANYRVYQYFYDTDLRVR